MSLQHSFLVSVFYKPHSFSLTDVDKELCERKRSSESLPQLPASNEVIVPGGGLRKQSKTMKTKPD